ncbi:MAG: Spy/CpxP family protein refolding chaperone [bacterium]
MNLFKNHKIITWAIIVLLIMNLFALGTIIYHIRSENVAIQPAPQPGTGNAQQIITRELNLSPEQFDRFKEYRQRYMIKSREIVRELNEQRQMMLDELSEDNPDSVYLNEIAKTIGILHQQLKEETIVNFLNLKSICTPEQQEKLEHLFRKMMEMEGPFRRGPGHRKGNRWRNQNPGNYTP